MRHNIFNKTHLPLKSALISACIALTDAINQPDGQEAAIQKVEKVLRVFKEQMLYETLHILPFIAEYEPSVSASYLTVHEELSIPAAGLQRLVRKYGLHQGGDQSTWLGSMIEAFNAFMMASFNHMDDEEAVLNEILWRYYRDYQLVQLEEQIEILPHLVQEKNGSEKIRIATAA